MKREHALKKQRTRSTFHPPPDLPPSRREEGKRRSVTYAAQQPLPFAQPATSHQFRPDNRKIFTRTIRPSKRHQHLQRTKPVECPVYIVNVVFLWRVCDFLEPAPLPTPQSGPWRHDHARSVWSAETAATRTRAARSRVRRLASVGQEHPGSPG